MNTTTSLPPLRDVRKPSDVEDPLNVHINRPLAYAIVRLIYKTPIKPDHVTYFAAVVGASAGALWFVDLPWAYALGGLLLWFSGILDGVDGVLARAKGLQSDWGRALDGAMDAVVAIATVSAGVLQLWRSSHSLWTMGFAIIAILATALQIYMYDFYKESYLYFTRPAAPDQSAQAPASEGSVSKMIAGMRQRGESWFRVFIIENLYLTLVRRQNQVVAFSNPAGCREGHQYSVGAEQAALYKQHHRGPILVWRWLGLGPHTYLFAICGAFGAFEQYMWLRVVPFGLVWLGVLLWQRAASEQTEPALRSCELATQSVPPQAPLLRN